MSTLWRRVRERKEKVNRDAVDRTWREMSLVLEALENLDRRLCELERIVDAA